MSDITTVSEQKCFDGLQGVYRHASAACGVDMRFAHAAAPLDDAATAEQVRLFSRRREFRVSLRQVRVVFHHGY